MGHAPFNVPLGPAAAFRARRWWQCFDGRLTIANLAAYLCDIVPFAGTPHRQDTLLGWYLGKASPSGTGRSACCVRGVMVGLCACCKCTALHDGCWDQAL